MIAHYTNPVYSLESTCGKDMSIFLDASVIQSVILDGKFNFYSMRKIT